MSQEDHNRADSSPAKIWAFDLGSEALTVVAETDPDERRHQPRGCEGVWETSGIVDVSRSVGAST